MDHQHSHPLTGSITPEGSSVTRHLPGPKSEAWWQSRTAIGIFWFLVAAAVMAFVAFVAGPAMVNRDNTEWSSIGKPVSAAKDPAACKGHEDTVELVALRGPDPLSFEAKIVCLGADKRVVIMYHIDFHKAKNAGNLGVYYPLTSKDFAPSPADGTITVSERSTAGFPVEKGYSSELMVFIVTSDTADLLLAKQSLYDNAVPRTVRPKLTEKVVKRGE